MDRLKAEIEAVLQLLRVSLINDFSALAMLRKEDHRIYWKHVSGNINDRYKYIVQKPGSGLTGEVIRLGRSIILDESKPDSAEKRYGYPIMLAEQLHSAAAAPVFIGERVGGVLFVGNRSLHVYSKKDIELITQFTQRIGVILEEDQFKKTIPMNPSL